MLPPRWMLYGTDGIGKSTFAAGCPKPIFLPTEDGCTRIAVDQFPRITEWSQLFEAIRTLCTEKHDYQTVILDSGDWAQPLAIEHVCQEEFNGSMASFDAYGKGYKSLLREWCKLLSALDFLHKRRNMEVGIIAHAVVRPFHNPAGDDYDRYESNLISTQSTSLWAKTKEWCDLVMFANLEVITRKDESGKAKAKGILKKGDGQRVVYTAPTAAWDAKVRAGWSLDDRFILDAAEFRRQLNQNPATNTATAEESENA